MSEELRWEPSILTGSLQVYYGPNYIGRVNGEAQDRWSCRLVDAYRQPCTLYRGRDAAMAALLKLWQQRQGCTQ